MLINLFLKDLESPFLFPWLGLDDVALQAVEIIESVGFEVVQVVRILLIIVKAQ
jgi:hypothetical protein